MCISQTSEGRGLRLIKGLESKEYTLYNIEESSLLFLLSGKLKLSYHEKLNQVIKSGSMLVFPAGSSLLVQFAEDASLIVCPFNLENYFPEQYIVELFQLIEHKITEPIVEIRGHMPEFLQLTATFLSEKTSCNELYTNLKKGLFNLLSMYYSKDELASLFVPVIGKDVVFKDFVLKNCLKVETVEQLASLANYSTSGFEKKFRKCFNEPPYQWILQYKAKRILQDIQISHIPFKELAEQYGFSSSSYFYTFCKKHFSRSPREIRKEGKFQLKRR